MDDIKIDYFCHRGHKACKWLDKESGTIKQCSNYMNIAGNDPQTGEVVDEWRCADVWIPILLVEASRNIHHNTASIQSFRNDVVKSNDAIGSILLSKNNEIKLVN